MNLQEAYTKAKKSSGKPYLLGCIDLSDKWVVLFSDVPKEDNENALYGGYYDIVDKSTGGTSQMLSNYTNIMLLTKGKIVDISAIIL